MEEAPKRLCMTCDSPVLPDQEFTTVPNRQYRPKFIHDNYQDCQAALSFGTWHSHHRHNTPGMVVC
jgi:hypothetical protein